MLHCVSAMPQTPTTYVSATLPNRARTVVGSRVVTAKWIATATLPGYNGAIEKAAAVDDFFGDEATARVIGDGMSTRIGRAIRNGRTPVRGRGPRALAPLPPRRSTE
jgi:cobalamin biosynthesis Mg chelatase CobN